jgi:Fe2+ or Zn2+ uptake regulation protein
MPADRVDQAIEVIRNSGGRVTVDRRAVVEALDQSSDHLTVEQLAEAVWALHPDINLGHGPSRWHLAGQVHHHLVCDACDAVIEVPDSTFDPLRRRLLKDTGFAIDPHHFSLVGLCSSCAANAAAEVG